MVVNLDVMFVLHIGHHEVSIDEWFYGNDLLILGLKLAHHFLLKQVDEPVTILIVDQSILEDALALVTP